MPRLAWTPDPAATIESARCSPRVSRRPRPERRRGRRRADAAVRPRLRRSHGHQSDGGGYRVPAGLLARSAIRRAPYDPQPLGSAAAREAVAADYDRRGVHVPSSHIVLTASSSESYSLLFKLLCDPGDSVLVPTPSYPLFEHLARLERSHALPYRHEYHGRWTLDLDDLAQRDRGAHAGRAGRQPQQPDGRMLKRDELTALLAFCARTAWR